MRRAWIAGLIVLFVVACAEDPTYPAAVREAPPDEPALTLIPAGIPALACTKTWSPSTISDWFDAGAWIPAGVPTSADVVCVTWGVVMIPGSNPVWAKSLDVSRGTIMSYDLHVVDTLILGTGALLTTSHQLDVGKAIVNHGTIEAFGASVVGNMSNYGKLVADRQGSSTWRADSFAVDGGSVGDPTKATVAIDAGFVQWTAGVGQNASIASSHVRIEGGDFDDTYINTGILEIGTQTEGRLSVVRADSIVGDIGRDLELSLGGAFSTTFTMRGTRSGPLTPVTNDGTIAIVSSPLGSPTLNVPGNLVNRGSIAAAGEATIVGGTLVNRSDINVSANMTVESGIENHGSIVIEPGIDLVMAPRSFFDARSGSEVTGSGGEVRLGNARLFGTGFLHNVVSAAGMIVPGDPYGTLFVENLDLDPLSTVRITIADTAPGQYSQLRSGGVVTLNGTLELKTKPPFEGGKCGHLVPALANSFITDGEFQTITGLAQTPQRAWRLQERADTLWVAGYRPSNRLTLDGSVVAVEEGGGPSSYRICMGTAAPAAPVTVSRYNVLGELVPVPPVTFDLADWALPRTVLAIALDDADYEGLHSDTITHIVATTDPTYSGTTLPSRAVTIVDNDFAADLTLIRVSQEDNQFVGDTMATVFRVANNGPSASTGSRVVSLPLVGLEYVSATGAACSLNGTASLRCTLGAIGAGSQADFTIRFRGAVAGLHTNTFTVTGLEQDPVAGNNTLNYTQRVW